MLSAQVGVEHEPARRRQRLAEKLLIKEVTPQLLSFVTSYSKTYILRKGCDYGRNSHVYLNPGLERGKKKATGKRRSDDGIVFLFFFKLWLVLMIVRACLCSSR